jgi:muramoyltetrapeptide carboxypeptidase
MVTAPFLKPGDTIAIVSTARKITEQELQPAKELIKGWGLKCVSGKTIGAEYHQFAGEDQLRKEDLQQMLDDPNIRAIWCARGGYGTVRIIDQLDFSAFKKNPKWIIGYSDVTVLHSHLHLLGFETLHAQMPLEIEKKSDETIDSIRKVIFGQTYEIKHQSRDPKNRKGRTKGQLVGGNLSILYSLCGSMTGISTKGKILFIEDLDEYLYHIDRMFVNLKRNKIFKNLTGLIIGGMTKMNDNTIPFGKTAEEIIQELVSEYDYPVCFQFPAGHINDNRALIMGREAELEINDDFVYLKFYK